MKNNNKKLKKAEIAALLALILCAPSLAEDTKDNILHKISLKENDNNEVTLNLQLDKKFPDTPLVFEKSKNIYFVSLPSTKYEGNRKIDFEKTNNNISDITVDYIPYKTSKNSGYTRIIINTKSDVKFDIKESIISTKKSLEILLLKIFGLLTAVMFSGVGIFLLLKKLNYIKFPKHNSNRPVNGNDNIELMPEVMDILNTDNQDNIVDIPPENSEKNIEIVEDDNTFELDPDEIIDDLLKNDEALIQLSDTILEQDENIEKETAEEIDLDNIAFDEENENKDVIADETKNMEEETAEEIDLDNIAFDEENENEDIIADKTENIEEETSEETDFDNIAFDEENVNEDVISDETEHIEEEIDLDNITFDEENENEDVIVDETKNMEEETAEEIDLDNITFDEENEDIIADETENIEEETSEEIDLDNIAFEEENEDIISDETENMEEETAEKIDLDNITFDEENENENVISDEAEHIEEETSEEIDLDNIAFEEENEDIIADETENMEEETAEEIVPNESFEGNNYSSNAIPQSSFGATFVVNNNFNLQMNSDNFNDYANNDVDDGNDDTENGEVFENEAISDNADVSQYVDNQVEFYNQDTSESPEDIISSEGNIEVKNDNDMELINKNDYSDEQNETSESKSDEIVDNNQISSAEQKIVFSDDIPVEKFFKNNEQMEPKEDIQTYQKEEYTAPSDMTTFFATEDENIYQDSYENMDIDSFMLDTKEYDEIEQKSKAENIYDKIDDSKEPVVLAQEKIDEDKQIYLLRHKGECSLVGVIDDKVFVLNKFDNIPRKKDIFLKYNESKNNKDIYIAKVESWRALISISEDEMENVLTLS